MQRSEPSRGPGDQDPRDTVRDLLKRTAVALKQSGVPFALCGGYAAWVRGAPEPEHDADFLVPQAEAERVAKALADAGLDAREPAEDWLVKVVGERTTEVFVDVLWRTCGVPVETDLIDRSDVLPVLSVQMPVLGATDILTTKLMALDEHYCDFARLLPVARALREQVDWPRVGKAVAANDFAVVFLQLLDRLGITGTEVSGAVAG
ncbi:MAG: uncharacterized protein JWO98_4371 [Frankiales bacterium]|nr:uncharacterized protein [Frankiales bacterium]